MFWFLVAAVIFIGLYPEAGYAYCTRNLLILYKSLVKSSSPTGGTENGK